MLYTSDCLLVIIESVSICHPSIWPCRKGVKVCICDAEEYGLPSMSVKTTPKFENRQIDAVIKGLVPRLTATMDNVVGKRK